MELIYRMDFLIKLFNLYEKIGATRLQKLSDIFALLAKMFAGLATGSVAILTEAASIHSAPVIEAAGILSILSTVFSTCSLILSVLSKPRGINNEKAN